MFLYYLERTFSLLYLNVQLGSIFLENKFMRYFKSQVFVFYLTNTCVCLINPLLFIGVLICPAPSISPINVPHHRFPCLLICSPSLPSTPLSSCHARPRVSPMLHPIAAIFHRCYCFLVFCCVYVICIIIIIFSILTVFYCWFCGFLSPCAFVFWSCCGDLCIQSSSPPLHRLLFGMLMPLPRQLPSCNCCCF